MEDSDDPIIFIKNAFGSGVSIKAVSFAEMGGKKVALVEIAAKDKGLAIGKRGRNIAKVKLLVEKHHGIGNVILI